MTVAFAWTGCAHAPTAEVAASQPAMAQVAIANLSDHAWKIEARAVVGRDVRSWQVLPRASLQIALAEGDYVFTQTVVSTAMSGTMPPREFPARFEAGQRYEWSLATLLSTAGESANGTNLSAR